MNDEDALIRAIVANPDEDTPRLIYADFLDEVAGPDRPEAARFARFIRAHILLDQPAPKKPRQPGFLGLLARMCIPVHGALATQFRLDRYKVELTEWVQADQDRRQAQDTVDEWFIGIHTTTETRFGGFPLRNDWRRGFLWRIHCTMGYWMLCGPNLAKRIPLTKVAITDKTPLEGVSWHNQDSPTSRRASMFWSPPRHSPEKWAAAAIPEAVFRKMAGVESYANWRQWKLGVCDEILSQAALAWARSV